MHWTNLSGESGELKDKSNTWIVFIQNSEVLGTGLGVYREKFTVQLPGLYKKSMEARMLGFLYLKTSLIDDVGMSSYTHSPHNLP